jgi:GNAT superfamily N-acetyltransferase
LWREDLTKFLTDGLTGAGGSHLLVIGLAGGGPVGLASLRADQDRREPLGQLELIYVEPAARQGGVAAAMLALVLARCAEWGLAGLDAPALPGNRAAKSFFERQGMQARMLVMHRPLGPPPGG